LVSQSPEKCGVKVFENRGLKIMGLTEMIWNRENYSDVVHGILYITLLG
jgi:hypothetical protein